MAKYKAERGIITAAGLGSRLLPITAETPKPLVEVNGRVIIESLIDGMIQHGVEEIYIVIGHLKGKFAYLPEKYGQIKLELIENPYYNIHNNISSLYVAREYLKNCIIAEGDLLIYNPEIFVPDFDVSSYCGLWANETKEWLLKTDANGIVSSCSRTGGTNGWQMFGVSFWREEDGEKLKKHLEDIYVEKKITDIFWDDIPLFYCKDEYQLKIRNIHDADIIEIDTIEELVGIDAAYSK